MEKCETITFYDYKDQTVIIEYQIEETHFKIPGSKLVYHTDKYIDVFTWFHISTMVDKLIRDIMQNEVDWKKKPKGKIILDQTHSAYNLRVNYRIMPKEESKVNMNKISYDLDWFLKIKIFNDSYPKEPKEPLSKQSSARSTPNLSPTRTKVKTEPNENEVVTIGSSQEMDFEDQIKPNKLRKVRSDAHSTPLNPRSDKNNENKKKPMTRAHTTLNSKLDADFQTAGAIQFKDSEEIIQDQKRIKVEKTQKKLDGWLGAGDARESNSERTNVTKRKKDRKVSEKTPEKPRSQPLQLMNPQQREKIENFVEQHKLKEAEKDFRRQELKDLEIWHCQDVSNEKLREIVEAHKDEIQKLFDAPHRARTNPIIKDMRFDSLSITTSETINDTQQLYVLKQIEKCRKNTAESRDDNLHEVVLPYITIMIFMDKYGLSLKEALERIEQQEEKKSLFNLNNLYDSR